VNNLRDKPMTQFSFEWILSLNSPSQFWGPLQTTHPMVATLARIRAANTWAFIVTQLLLCS
jgi:hypothetical protein